MRLYTMSAGTLRVDKGAILTPGLDDGRMITIPVPVYLIEVDDATRVLVDTGLHPVHIADPGHSFRGIAALAGVRMEDTLWPTMSSEDDFVRQLGLCGFEPSDITHLVNTHLHFDHCGNNRLFRDVPIIVQRQHYEWAIEHDEFPSEYFESPTLSYSLIDGDAELFPGVRAIVTSGHAPFHQSLIVELPATGNVLLCVDAIYTADNLKHGLWSNAADPDAAKRSAEALASLAASEDAMMIFGHDPEQWATLRHGAAYYD